MKKLLLLAFVFLAYFESNAQQALWLPQATAFTPVSSGVRNICVLDTNVVWISAYDGAQGSGLARRDYSRTADGGQHWYSGTVPAPAGWEWSMITATDDSNAWAVFFNDGSNPIQYGQIWHTTDAGLNWTQQGGSPVNTLYTSTGSFPNVIHFWNNNDGVVIGDPVSGEFEIYTTSDGGSSWTPVPGANIPDPLASEAGWTTHIQAVGDTVWFDTNSKRVYRSIDHGLNWTVSATTLPVPASGEFEMCFYSHLDGIARYFDATLVSNSIVETHDGGDTWSAVFTPIGNVFASALAAVPGVDSMLVSTGADTSYSGSSYSMNGGHNWIDIETGTEQRGALGIADSLTMWCGGFTTSPTAEGIFKYTIIYPVSCSDTIVDPGTTTLSDTALCFNDTLIFSSTGIQSPVNGDFSGIGWIITTIDISGNTNYDFNTPDTSYKAAFAFLFPAPETDTRLFVNDGTFIGVNIPFGTYYFTPVVFANATALTATPVFLSDLFLDPTCTFPGTSIAVNVQDATVCDITGVHEMKVNQLELTSMIKDQSTLDVRINAITSGKISIQILDLTGRVVNSVNGTVSSGINHQTVNIESLASGTYIIKAEVNGIRGINKVVIN